MKKQTYNQIIKSGEILLILLIVVLLTFLQSIIFSYSTKNKQEKIDKAQTAEAIEYHQSQGRNIEIENGLLIIKK